MSKNIEFKKCLICSTGHMTSADNSLLEKLIIDENYWLYSFEYGWIFNLLGIRNNMKHIKNLGLSNELYRFVFNMYLIHHCDLLMFDRDADSIDGYTVFDW
ncbi:DUF5983 family protein [Photorhabdus luminescens]|uniref:DUF5983 family protein n=1 Tax=Photorhabdus luminescens TaxID=29488 RepID=UPI0022404E01|nr:DUF5983 family protein [Photorhabdus luminescens]MCW7763461.1 DUF5983 family protein [Photorhabdus luminescens subsp. venezuelensis]